MSGDVFLDDVAFAALSAANPGRDLIVINRLVSRKLHADLSACISTYQQSESVAVVLTTVGGDPHAGYRVARCLRHHYKKGIKVLVPSWCKSAGTLIAIGADELSIGDMGELGPLDMQILKPGEVLQRDSGLDAGSALAQCLSHAQQAFLQAFQNTRVHLKLSQKLAGEIASAVVAGIAAPLYSQIDPIRLGAMQRAMAITLHYGQRLNADSKNLKPGAISTLLSDYPAHDFVIDRREARELFFNVAPLSDSEKLGCNQLWKQIGSPAADMNTGFGPVFLAPTPPAQPQAQPQPQPQAGVDHGLSNGNASTAGGGAPPAPNSQPSAAPGATAPTGRKKLGAGKTNR